MSEEGFLTGLHRSWFAWSGWLFTVAGTVFSLVAGGAYAWVGALVAAAGLVALTALAYQRHQELRQAEGRHATEVGRLEGELQTARSRAEQAERKLNEGPADILQRLQATIQRHAFAEVAEGLARHAEYVQRMAALTQVVTRPVVLRTFAKRAGGLYVEGRLSADAIQHLRQDAPFVLEYKDANALVTTSALLRAHQLDAGKAVVWFRVEGFVGHEMKHVAALAEKQDVPAKGDTARPVCDVARYGGLELTNLSAAIRALTAEAQRLQE